MQNVGESESGGTLVRDIFIVKQNDSKTAGVITIGYPYENRMRGHWSCEVSISEILPRRTLHGEDALQALLLAVKYAHSHVEIAKKDGILLFWTDESDLCDLRIE